MIRLCLWTSKNRSRLVAGIRKDREASFKPWNRQARFAFWEVDYG